MRSFSLHASSPTARVGVLDVSEVLERDGNRIDVHAGGYLVPPVGFMLPAPEILLAPGFTWPEIDLPMHGFVTFDPSLLRRTDEAVGLVANAVRTA